MISIMPKIQLSFHTTFPLKKEDVIQVFRVAATQELGLENSIDNLMISTGLGNRKIPPMISWATRGGLLADKRLSKAGEIVFRFDPHLESIVTDWLMHFYLSFGKYGLEKPFDIPAEWGGWTYFVYEFLPQYPSFTWENFSYHFASVFDEENRNTLVKNIRIMLRAYTEPYGLAKCQFVQKNKDLA